MERIYNEKAPTPEITEAVINTADEENEEPVIAEEASDDWLGWCCRLWS